MKLSPTHFSLRLYCLLLRLYPQDFRREYSTAMTHIFCDLYRDTYQQSSRWRMWLFWLHTVADLLISAPREHIALWKKDFRTRDFRRFGWAFILLPGLGAVAVFLSGTRASMMMYIWVGLWGILGLLLSKMRLIRPVAEWNLIGVAALALPVCILLIWFGSVPGVGLAIWLTLFFHFRRRITIPPVSWWLIRALIANAVIWTLLRTANYPDPSWLTYFSDFSFTLSWSLMMVVAVLFIGRFISNGQGGVLAVLFILGMAFDFAGFSHIAGQSAALIHFSGVIFPLLLCPAWLILARTTRARQWGTLALWAVMLLIGGLGANVGRADLPYETLASHLSRITAVVPYFLTLLMALQLFGQEELSASSDNRDTRQQNRNDIYALETKGR